MKELNLSPVLFSLFYVCFAILAEAEVIFPVKPFTFKTLNLNSNETLQIEVRNVETIYRYIQIGVHSQKKKVIISEKMSPDLVGTYITGNDVGLVILLEENQVSGSVWIINRNEIDITVLLTILLKNSTEPIPGGCNLEFPVEISPFLRIIFGREITRLEYQHANIGYERDQYPPPCSIVARKLSYDVYVYFLNENDFDEKSYFKALVTMTEVKDIYSMAKKISPLDISPKTRISFLSYPHQGVVYNIIAHYSRNGTYEEAAYIPAVTYGCNFSSKVDGCGHLTSLLGKVVVIICAVFGFFLCLFGHQLNKTATFFFGFLAFALISFILLTRYAHLESLNRDTFTLSCGIIFGLLCVLISSVLHISFPFVILKTLVFGFLLAAILYFTPLGEIKILRNDTNYWLLFSCIVLFSTLILFPDLRMSDIITTSVVGSYTCIIAIDRFIGTILSYIVLNIVKRLLFEDLNLASNVYPFQKEDIILTSVWGGFAIFGICFQYCMTREGSLPSFSRTVFIQRHLNHDRRDTTDDENRPLLHGESRGYNSVNS